MKATCCYVVFLLVLASCGQAQETGATPQAQPENFDADECEVCGMILREQPAPRAQTVHRDGARRYFCSIGDLMAYQAARSPHGESIATYAETVEPNVVPADVRTEQLGWRDVRQVTFVLGGLRRPVMGEPVLTFASTDEGSAAAERLGARAVSWDELATTISALASASEIR